MDGILFQVFVYLCAAVIAVPIAKRLGLGSVLGYLIAGILIGPVIGLVGAETSEIQHFAELGVVMMLFLIGLELDPGTLWRMRASLLGLGGLQVALTTVLIAAAALLFGADWRLALAIGLIFSLSSTAIVLQTLTEKGLTSTAGGRSSFSVLLFQDIAMIPMLALLPLLASTELLLLGADTLAHAPETQNGHLAQMSLVANLPGWAHGLVVLAAVAALLLGGHFLSRPLLRFVAESRLREIFTATVLLLVVGIALLMTLVDLSPALGTFIAGVVLANSEFRHELESDIEPFKGLLLGLFFITVGAGIDFAILFGDLTTVLGLTVGVIVLKGCVLLALAWLFRLQSADRWLFTLGLAQAGEFGFVLLSFSLHNSIIAPDDAKLLSLVVALSMLLTPALFVLYDKLFQRRRTPVALADADEIDEQGPVIIAGIGRFGQIVNRLLIASGVRTVVLDHEAAQIEMQYQLGIKSFFGDATRLELLRAAGIEQAQLLIVAIDDPDRAVEMVELVRKRYPAVRILARAFDVNHLYLLREAGADVALREVFDTSLRLGAEALKQLGMHPFKVEKMARAFRRHDEAGLDQLYELWDEHPDIARNRAFLARAREHRETLAHLMETDRLQRHNLTERAWTPPSSEDLP